MYEIWTYAVSPADRQGLLRGVGRRRARVRPARPSAGKTTTIPTAKPKWLLFKDQGLIHEITTSVSYVDKILWVATYFGASRYDGRNWHNFLQKDSGLPSNFINQVKAHRRQSRLVLHRQGTGLLRRHELGGVSSGARHRTSRRCWCATRPEWSRTIPVQSAPAHNYILGVDFQGDDIWVATAKGLSHGIRQKNL